MNSVPARPLRWLTQAVALGLTALGLQGCGAGQASQPIPQPSAADVAASPRVSIELDATADGLPVNRLVLGSNVQWVDGGDNLLVPDTLDFDPKMLALVQSASPTILRYPGGQQSDLYDWRRGLGPLASRGTNEQAGSHRMQVTRMGSAELLQLTDSLHAEALFTVNALTGTAADAAAWVAAVNTPLSRVTYWEIGNEPYLPNADGSHPDTCLIDPVTYATRINAFVHAMRAVDRQIKIGIALANETSNGIQFVSPGCRGYADRVLSTVTQPIDFISIHDAYLPYDPSGRDHPPADEYWAAMAATRSIDTDLGVMRALLAHYPRFSALPFAITEYNALFSLNPHSEYIHTMASPLAALYVADALRWFAGNDSILMANTWSLTANDHWGAIHGAVDASGPYPRPTYEVFRLFSDALQGTRLSATVRGPTFDAPRLGFTAAATGLPLITTLATRTEAGQPGGLTMLHLILINKDLSLPHGADIKIAHAVVHEARATLLTSTDVFQSDDRRGAMQRSELPLTLPAGSAAVSVMLPAHSITLVSMRVTAPQGATPSP